MLFAQAPYNVRVRGLLERRYVMEAWYTAVAINTEASFQAFLASYPDSDLAATARKMRERVRNRSFQPWPVSCVMRSRAKRSGLSTITVRTPLPAIRSSIALKPGRSATASVPRIAPS